jgi:hypothetical protein
LVLECYPVESDWVDEGQEEKVESGSRMGGEGGRGTWKKGKVEWG